MLQQTRIGSPNEYNGRKVSQNGVSPQRSLRIHHDHKICRVYLLPTSCIIFLPLFHGFVWTCQGRSFKQYTSETESRRFSIPQASCNPASRNLMYKLLMQRLLCDLRSVWVARIVAVLSRSNSAILDARDSIHDHGASNHEGPQRLDNGCGPFAESEERH